MGKRSSRKQLFESLSITDAGAKGKSIAHAPDGRVIFVNNAVPGDVCDIQTYKKRKAYFEGKAVNFHRYSERRVEPVCEYFGECGGCKWQFMNYESQLEFKENEVRNNLVRLGKIELPEGLPILGSKEQYFYRNKMEFSFSSKRWIRQKEVDSQEELNNRDALGFHIPGAWDKILDIDQCHLQEDPSNEIRNFVRDFAKDKGIAFFDPREKTGLLRSLMLRISGTTGQVMVLIQFYQNQPEHIALMMQAIQEKFPQIHSLLYVINEKDNDTLYDQEVHVFAGEDFIEETMEGLKFRVGPKSFYQTNSKQAYHLYELTRNFAGLSGEELVYDLYTGTGTIAQFVAQKAKQVIGVEIVPEAIEDAKKNAALNGVDNALFFAGDMKKVFTDAFIAEHGQPDVVITDPPREGMHAEVVETLLRLGAPRIVYVSCNSATQARDLALLDEQYAVKQWQAVDMFPQTYHVENVVLLEKRS